MALQVPICSAIMHFYDTLKMILVKKRGAYAKEAVITEKG